MAKGDTGSAKTNSIRAGTENAGSKGNGSKGRDQSRSRSKIAGPDFNPGSGLSMRPSIGQSLLGGLPDPMEDPRYGTTFNRHSAEVGEALGLRNGDPTLDPMVHAMQIHTLQKVPIERLLDNPYQPRLQMDEESLEQLSQVIRRHGFQGHLLARPHGSRLGYYELAAGHRRREAARRAGLYVLPVLVKPLTDEAMATLTLTENIQREDLTPLEEGKLYALMLNEMGYTQEELAKEIGKSRGYLQNRLRVAVAPEDVQALVRAKPDTIRAVYYLSKVEDESLRAEIIEGLLEGRLQTDDVPGYIEAVGAREGREDTEATEVQKAQEAHREESVTRAVESQPANHAEGGLYLSGNVQEKQGTSAQASVAVPSMPVSMPAEATDVVDVGDAQDADIYQADAPVPPYTHHAAAESDPVASVMTASPGALGVAPGGTSETAEVVAHGVKIEAISAGSTPSMPASSHTSEPETSWGVEEARQARLGMAKLSTMLRGIRSYKDAISTRALISRSEYEFLVEISGLSLELVEGYGNRIMDQETKD